MAMEPNNWDLNSDVLDDRVNAVLLHHSGTNYSDERHLNVSNNIQELFIPELSKDTTDPQ